MRRNAIQAVDQQEIATHMTFPVVCPLIATCDESIFIGNARVRAHKPIWAWPHEKLMPTLLYSCAVNGSADFVAIWRRSEQIIREDWTAHATEPSR